jgi:hypothetical protein
MMTFRDFLEQMPPPGMPAPQPGPPGELPNWNNLAFELGIEPEDLKNQTFVGSWVGPASGNLSNLRAFTVHAVDHKGDKINGLQVDFLPTTKSGTKGLRDLVKGRQSQKWQIVPKGARTTKRIPQYVDFNWFNKVIFQDKGAGAQGMAGGPSTLPGAGVP